MNSYQFYTSTSIATAGHFSSTSWDQKFPQVSPVYPWVYRYDVSGHKSKGTQPLKMISSLCYVVWNGSGIQYKQSTWLILFILACKDKPHSIELKSNQNDGQKQKIPANKDIMWVQCRWAFCWLLRLSSAVKLIKLVSSWWIYTTDTWDTVDGSEIQQTFSKKVSCILDAVIFLNYQQYNINAFMPNNTPFENNKPELTRYYTTKKNAPPLPQLPSLTVWVHHFSVTSVQSPKLANLGRCAGGLATGRINGKGQTLGSTEPGMVLKQPFSHTRGP